MKTILFALLFFLAAPNSADGANIPDKCREHIQWAVASGKHHPNADVWYSEMRKTSRISIKDANFQDFQRLFKCANIQASDCNDKGLSFPATCSSSPCNTCTTIATQNIRVMSYNMFAWNAIQRHPEKTPNLYKTVKAFGPDILGAQEIEQTKKIAANIGNDYLVSGGASAGHAILYRSSLFDLIKYGNKNLKEQDRYGLRTVEFAQFIHKPSGHLVDFFNTHFCVCNEHQLLNSARQVAEFIQQNRRPGSLVIFTGDLNVIGSSENHRAIKYFKGELGGDMPPIVLDDTFRTVNDKGVDGTTFINKGKIDYIFANQGSNVQSANIDRNWYGPASDHLPINAVINVL